MLIVYIVSVAFLVGGGVVMANYSLKRKAIF